MPHTEDQVMPAAILDAQAVDEIKGALRAGAALASTLTEAGIASSNDSTLICSITESQCDAALSRLDRAAVNPRAKTDTPKGPR
jgi:hypothetical protein